MFVGSFIDFIVVFLLFIIYTMSQKATYFQEEWRLIPEFSSWLQSVKGDRSCAKCSFCQKTIKLSNMGRRALTSHKEGTIHKRNAKTIEEASKNQSPISAFLGKNRNNAGTLVETEIVVDSSAERPISSAREEDTDSLTEVSAIPSTSSGATRTPRTVTRSPRIV